MSGGRKNRKKLGASLMAAVMVAAIALTGTLAWVNMSQKASNEFLVDKNPGGRIHDDFNGVENKDIYAENFTDNLTGSPVFVRIKLSEYMETGEDAGIKRDVVDGTRQATPLIEGAEISDTSTWRVHKPDTEGEVDPFHEYWTWDYGGTTVYMPTFNKNKDSISPEVNGTYVGADGDFETGEPYDDYVTYTNGQESDELPAYYDADPNDVDEYNPNADPPQAPGGGGTEKTDENPDGNYTKTNEKHTAQSTLNGLGVMTMQGWLDAGQPICNKWVWDEDGWYYWPEPVMPETATGLLLNQVTQNQSTSGKCYYAINVVGQFADKNSWGSAATEGEGGAAEPATGFYIDGITDNAVALLNQAAKVEVGRDNKWYLNLGQGVYKEIQDDEGSLGGLTCAGEDKVIGTEDDRTDVEYVEGGLTVNGTNYGQYFLRPTATENYYRSVGGDDKLGTADDGRLWLTAGDFPGGTLVDKVVDTVTVKAPAGMSEFTEGETTMVEAEVGTTLPPFTAEVKLGEADASNTEVTWSVAPAARAKLAPNTKIGETTGILTIDENETNTLLIVTARSKLDNRRMGTYTVKVYGKVNVKITLADGTAPTEVQAGKTVALQAKLYRGKEEAPQQPESFTWSADNTPAATLSLRAVTPDVDAVQMDNGALTVGRAITGTVTVTAQCTVGGETKTGTLTLNVTPADEVTLTLTGDKESIEPGDATGVTFTATLNGPTDELENTGVSWTVGKLAEDGETIQAIGGVSITDGKVTLPADYSIDTNGATLWVKATARDPSVNASAKTSISVVEPTAITIARADGKALKIKPDGVPVTLTAKVMKSETEEYAGSAVTWEAGDNSGNKITGVTIDKDTGALTVATTVALDTEITVKATSKVKADVVGEAVVVVSDNTLTIGGVEFYVLYEDTNNNRQLILSKDGVTKMEFSSDEYKRLWADSPIRSWLNDTWLDTVTGLRDMVWTDTNGEYAPIYTRKVWNDETNYDEFKDPVFLLSEADVFGNSTGHETTNPKDYTTGLATKLPYPWGTEWRAWGLDYAWWLRSLYHTSGVGAVENDGRSNAYGTSYNYLYVRPALWIRLDATVD